MGIDSSPEIADPERQGFFDGGLFSSPPIPASAPLPAHSHPVFAKSIGLCLLVPVPGKHGGESFAVGRREGQQSGGELRQRVALVGGR